MQRNANSAITPETRARFDADGFVVIKAVFSAAEIADFRVAVDQAVTNRTASDSRKLTEKSLYEQSFTQCMGLWEDHEDVKAISFHPRLGAIAAALLEVDRIRLWQDQALYKTAGGRLTDAHQDYPFWPVDTPDLVSAWIPLETYADGEGIMGYLQGSHRLGLDEFADIGNLVNDAENRLLQHPKLAGIPTTWITPPLGAVIFHHAQTVHLAQANSGSRTRRAFTCVYMRDGARRSRADASVYLDRDNIKPGDVIAGPGLPIAWPLTAGKFPDSPEVLGPRTGFLPDPV